jgi:phage terminase large subunit-like protein
MLAVEAPPRRMTRARSAQPFTVPHFEQWALDLELDNGEPWKVEDYFGAFLEDYFAGIPENWLIVPEGNAKTTNLGGLACYLLEFRPYAAVPWAASSRDQAEIGYRQAEGFVLRTPRLSAILKCQEGYRRIKRQDSKGRMQVFAADDSTGDGIIPTDAFIDELHRHKNLRLYRTWRGKLGKRSGQLATISTAGEPYSEFELTRERIRQETPVIERTGSYVHCRSERIALHEWAVPEGGDVEDMAVVKSANPFTGITEPELETKFSSPTMTLAHWRRFVCNLPTRSENAAIEEAEWESAATDDGIPAGTPIWLGLDVAWKYDTTAAVPLWFRDSEYRLFGVPKILTPPRDGTMLDPYSVQRAVSEIHERNPIGTVVMDTSRAEELGLWLEQEIGATVVDRSQTNQFAVEDFDRFTEALRNGWIKHPNDQEFNRHVLNAIARLLPQGDARFDRPSSTRQGGNNDSRVIDALTAAAMVHSVAVTQPVEKEPLLAWR